MDVLVLAALEGQITAANAGTVRARILAEGANGPVTPDADPILARNGVVVIPDILCNAGGVIVSYFEWAQNREVVAWTLDEINERLRADHRPAPRRGLAVRRADGIEPVSRPMPSPSSASPRRPAAGALPVNTPFVVETAADRRRWQAYRQVVHVVRGSAAVSSASCEFDRGWLASVDTGVRDRHWGSTARRTSPSTERSSRWDSESRRP